MDVIQFLFRKYTLVLLFLFFLFAGNRGKAQYAQFMKKGAIVFQKRINLNALIQKKFGDKNDFITSKLISDYRNSYPASFRAIEYSLIFNKDQSIYSRITKTSAEEDSRVGEVLGCNNRVLMDFKNKRIDMNILLSGQSFLLSDTVPKILWKVTDEIRDISGFSCRRANGLMMDSLYVVAFFTTQIPVSAGPEIVNGLPGMILGLAIPSLHTTWFATKVQSDFLPIKHSVENTGEKSIRFLEYIRQIGNNLFNWQVQQSLL